MKKARTYLAAALSACLIPFAWSCDDGELENAGEQADEAIEEVQDEVDDAIDDN